MHNAFTARLRKQRAIELIAAGVTPADAARQIGISERHIRRYLADGAARAAIQRAWDDRLDALAARALAESTAALDLLTHIAHDESVPAAARIMAAWRIIDAAARLRAAATAADARRDTAESLLVFDRVRERALRLQGIRQLAALFDDTTQPPPGHA